jgi:hypothetical protein
VTVLPIGKAIEKALSGVEADLVIALSSMRESEQIVHIKALQKVHLLLGGAIDERTTRVQQIGKQILFVNPEGRGREVAHISFRFNDTPKLFHHPDLARAAQKQRKNSEKKLIALGRELASKPRDENVLRMRTQLEQERARYPKLKVKAPKGATRVEFGQQMLDAKFRVNDRQKNPLARIQDAYKSDLAKRAKDGKP